MLGNCHSASSQLGWMKVNKLRLNPDKICWRWFYPAGWCPAWPPEIHIHPKGAYLQFGGDSWSIIVRSPGGLAWTECLSTALADLSTVAFSKQPRNALVTLIGFAMHCMWSYFQKQSGNLSWFNIRVTRLFDWLIWIYYADISSSTLTLGIFLDPMQNTGFDL